MGDHFTAGVAFAAAWAAAAVITAAPTPVAAQSIACGSDYVVQRGDTLSEIAARTYGTGRFGPIFSANRSVITAPQRLEVGDRLFIPCLDGQGQPLPRGVGATAASIEASPAPEPAPSPPAEAPTTAALTTNTPGFQAAPNALSQAIINAVPPGSVVKLLAVRPTAPYVGEKLPEGGMLTEIVQRALLRAPVPLDFAVTFSGGQSALDVGAGDYDLGFPVARPNCEAPGTLGVDDLMICKEYDFSAPIFAEGIGMFVTKTGDFAAAKSAGDLFGARVCRPEGMPTADLEKAGLDQSTVSVISAPSAADCFMLLDNGDVQVVSLPTAEGEDAIAELGIARRIVSLKGIGEGTPLHVVSPKTSAFGQAWIEIINRGLAEMRASGEYEAVIDNHLQFAKSN